MPTTSLPTSLPARPALALPNSLAGKATLAVAATGLMALAAHISLPLPFSPVPLALTPFAVLVIGITLGPATAFVAMALYLAEGASGLPVFTPQGPGGIAQLLGPTGGFLLAYPFAAVTAGWLVRHLRAPQPFARSLVASTAAIALIFAFGATWLAALLHLHTAAAWQLAVAPFLPGEAVKIVAAATLYATMHRGIPRA
jgi:biotin transport system substrate-specific component